MARIYLTSRLYCDIYRQGPANRNLVALTGKLHPVHAQKKCGTVPEGEPKASNFHSDTQVAVDEPGHDKPVLTVSNENGNRKLKLFGGNSFFVGAAFAFFVVVVLLLLLN